MKKNLLLISFLTITSMAIELNVNVNNLLNTSVNFVLEDNNIDNKKRETKESIDNLSFLYNLQKIEFKRQVDESLTNQAIDEILEKATELDSEMEKFKNSKQTLKDYESQNSEKISKLSESTKSELRELLSNTNEENYNEIEISNVKIKNSNLKEMKKRLEQEILSREDFEATKRISKEAIKKEARFLSEEEINAAISEIENENNLSKVDKIKKKAREVIVKSNLEKKKIISLIEKNKNLTESQKNLIKLKLNESDITLEKANKIKEEASNLNEVMLNYENVKNNLKLETQKEYYASINDENLKNSINELLENDNIIIEVSKINELIMKINNLVIKLSEKNKLPIRANLNSEKYIKYLEVFDYNNPEIVNLFNENIYFNIGLGANIKSVKDIITKLNTGISINVIDDFRMGGFIGYDKDKSHNINTGVSFKYKGMKSFLRYRYSIYEKAKMHSFDGYIQYAHNFKVLDSLNIDPSIAFFTGYSSETIIDDYVKLKPKFKFYLDLGTKLSYEIKGYNIYGISNFKIGKNETILVDRNYSDNIKSNDNKYFIYSLLLGLNKKYRKFKFDGNLGITGDEKGMFKVKSDFSIGYDF